MKQVLLLGSFFINSEIIVTYYSTIWYNEI